jgi:hypothetical protein
MAELGGIEIVIAAMQKHATDAIIKNSGCGLLSNLAFENASNSVKISALCGIETILTAMVTHKADANIQQNGCWAIFLCF